MTVFYVSTTGNDSNSGVTPDRPFLTIGRGAAVAGPGDSVLVASGTYTVTSSIIMNTSGTSETARIVFASFTPRGAKVVNNIAVTDSADDAAVQLNADYQDFLGFDISGSGRIGVYNSGSSTGSGNPPGSRNRIRANFVHDLGLALDGTHNVSGINGSRYGSGIYNAIINEVSGNELRNIGNSHNSGNHGIYFGTAYASIFNNIVNGVPGYGIRSFHFSNHMLIAHNLCFNCGDSSADPNGGQGGGIYISAGGTGWTAGVDEPNDFTVVANNIIRDCVGWGGILETANNFGNPNPQVVANNSYYANCAFNNSGIHDNVELDSGAVNVNGLTVDPRFLNYRIDGTGNYHLAPNSPCIDSAFPVGILTDFDGNKRPSGYGWDIGPYEVKQISFHG